MLQIYTVWCRRGIMDNLSYILVDTAGGQSAVVDPSEAGPIILELDRLGLRPQYILNTHHHFDHTDGNLELKNRYGAQVVGNAADAHRLPGFDLGLQPGGFFDLGESRAEIIDVSAHTQNHILYYFAADKALFTGDTLFNLCVGGLFEGTMQQMNAALQKIAALPDDVLFYPGHEYTLQAAADAGRPEDNPALAEYFRLAEERLNQGLPVSPLPLGLEKQCNPYFLYDKR